MGRSRALNFAAWARVALVCVGVGLPAGGLVAGESIKTDESGAATIVLATTTSTENSGVLEYLFPEFEGATGIVVRVVSVGTGQALRIGRDGDADVLLVHDRRAEEQFVLNGYGSERRDVMYNDFVVVGPAGDPAALRGIQNAAAAVATIAQQSAPFVSRGDDSGTHKAERRLWAAAALEPWETASGDWYIEAGAGMGQTLNVAVGMGAYVLVDRGTWLSFRNKGDLEILVEGDARLFNPYGVILVNPARHAHVKADAARQFADWITGKSGQAMISSFRVAGEPLFIPNADGKH